MFMFRAPATLVLAVINAAALESAGRRGRVLAAVDAEAQIQLKGSGGGLRLAGAAALRELRAPRAQKAAGCRAGVARGLVHRLRGSRTNASVDETPLSYMRADHEVHQVGLAVFDLWSSDSSQMLDEDAGAVLQPFLQDVETWRAACGGQPGTGRVLLVLPGGAEASDASLWQQMSAEFAAHVARKVLRMRPQDVQVWQPRDDNPLAGLLSDAKQARCFDRVAVLSGDAWAFAWNQRFKCNPQDGRLVLKFVESFLKGQTASDPADEAQVCLAQAPPDTGSLQRCQLQGRPVQLQAIAPQSAAQCEAFVALANVEPSGAELLLRSSTPFVEIVQGQSSIAENLALLTGAKHFTLAAGSPGVQDQVGLALLALNRAGAGIVAQGGPLDGEVSKVVELEGCEEFYHPADGWLEGWRDVARSVQLAKRNESFMVQLPKGSVNKNSAALKASDMSEDEPAPSEPEPEQQDAPAKAKKDEAPMKVQAKSEASAVAEGKGGRRA
ncbi:unnamed protein product [Effrenium voratum]|nr:unnamed protein product [Effrenium voratum]